MYVKSFDTTVSNETFFKVELNQRISRVVNGKGLKGKRRGQFQETNPEFLEGLSKNAKLRILTVHDQHENEFPPITC
jgi:hypothetical protein